MWVIALGIILAIIPLSYDFEAKIFTQSSLFAKDGDGSDGGGSGSSGSGSDGSGSDGGDSDSGDSDSGDSDGSDSDGGDSDGSDSDGSDSDGSDSDNSGSGSDNSGPGNSNSGSDNSESDSSSNNSSRSNNEYGGSYSRESYSKETDGGSRNVFNLFRRSTNDAIPSRFGKVVRTRILSTGIEIYYSDGWIEKIKDNKYQLFNKKKKLIISRKVRNSDRRRFQKLLN